MDANGEPSASGELPVRPMPTALNAAVVYATVIGAYVVALAFLGLVLWFAGRTGLWLLHLIG
jgi:hypothetical protein